MYFFFQISVVVLAFENGREYLFNFFLSLEYFSPAWLSFERGPFEDALA